MLDSIQGKVIEVKDGECVVESGGLGFRLYLTPFNVPKEGEHLRFLLRSFLRESGEFIFYGFLEEKERAVFDALRGVRGINHRTAFKILSRVRWEEFVVLVVREELAFLESRGGVGSKTAKRLVLELKPLLLKAGFDGGIEFPEVFEEAKEVLFSLGYSVREVNQVMDSLWHELQGETVDVEVVIRKALLKLGGER